MKNFGVLAFVLGSVVMSVCSTAAGQGPVVCTCKFDTDDKSCADLYGNHVYQPNARIYERLAVCLVTPCFGGACGEQPVAPLQMDIILQNWNLPRSWYRGRDDESNETGGEDLMPGNAVYCAFEHRCEGCRYMAARPNLAADYYCDQVAIGRKPFPTFKDCPGPNFCGGPGEGGGVE